MRPDDEAEALRLLSEMRDTLISARTHTAISETLRAIQAEQRTIRDEKRLIRLALSDAINALMERIGTFEALIDIRIDQLSVLSSDILTRLDRIEAKLP